MVLVFNPSNFTPFHFGEGLQKNLENFGHDIQKTFEGEWNPLNDSLDNFTAALEKGEKVWIDRSGQWSVLTSIRALPTHVPLFEKMRLEQIAKVFVSRLDQLEKIPVSVNSSEFDGQSALLEKHKKALDAIQNQLAKYPQSKRIGQQSKSLRQRWVAIQYRMEAGSSGLDKEYAGTTEDFQKLEKWAESWKKSYALYQDSTLLEEEKQKLEEVASYPEFVKVLEGDFQLRSLFFKWALRDNNSVDAFVQFPATVDRLRAAYLGGRIGYFAKENLLRIQKKDGIKDLTLPFEVQEGSLFHTKRISILNSTREVNLRGNYKLTIDEIFKVFAGKNDAVGNLELMGKKGICNWHPNELGWWDPESGQYKKVDISVENSEWWEELPVWETIRKEDALKKYGLKDVAPGEWIAVVKASREAPTLDINKCHGYLEVLIPDAFDKEKYSVYPIGKFTKIFPSKVISKFFFITDTVEARYQYPDDNPLLPRQQAAIAFRKSSEQGRELMENIRKDFKEGQEGRAIFQFGQLNCASWPQMKMEQLEKKFEENPSLEEGEAVEEGLIVEEQRTQVSSNDNEEKNSSLPNIFRTPLLEATPSFEPMKSLFRFGRWLDVSEKVKIVLVKIGAFLFGSWRWTVIEENGKKIYHSMMNSNFSEKAEVYLPSILHEKIQKSVLDGRVYFGNFFANQTKVPKQTVEEN